MFDPVLRRKKLLNAVLRSGKPFEMAFWRPRHRPAHDLLHLGAKGRLKGLRGDVAQVRLIEGLARRGGIGCEAGGRVGGEVVGWHGHVLWV